MMKDAWIGLGLMGVSPGHGSTRSDRYAMRLDLRGAVRHHLQKRVAEGEGGLLLSCRRKIPCLFFFSCLVARALSFADEDSLATYYPIRSAVVVLEMFHAHWPLLESVSLCQACLPFLLLLFYQYIHGGA